MTFGALAAWQGWILLVAAAAIAAGLFLLKLRPPRVVVPSLLLWRRVLDEARELTLWERIRRAVSLVLTMLIACALALAIARPVGRAGAGGARGRLLIVLDSSWSMLSRTSDGETRWARGLAEARRLAAAAGGEEVAMATTADGLVEGPTTDLALIDSALDRIAPAGGAMSAWPRLAGTAAVHFITDAAVERPVPPGTIVDSVFEPAPNVGITAFEVRPVVGTAGDRRRAGDAYLEIGNFAPAAQQVRLILTRGPATLLDRPIAIGPNEAVRQVVPLASGGDPLLRARIEAPRDALEIDNEAVAWIREAEPLSVTVVGRQTAWLAALFRQDANVRATFVDPAVYKPGQADAVIFDRCAPAEAPDRPALLFAPPADTAWLDRAGADPPAGSGVRIERQPQWRDPSDHPILRGVDPLTVTISAVHAYRSPALVAIAVSARGTPLVSVDQSSGRRLAIVGFGPDESNLPSAPGFPVLVDNALHWLARPELVRTGRSGEIVFDPSVVKVTGPRGRAVPLQRVDGDVIGLLREPGLYVAETGAARRTIPVNIADPQISNVERTTMANGRGRAVTAEASPRPWWAYCAVAAFGLLLLEWFTWQRRITV